MGQDQGRASSISPTPTRPASASFDKFAAKFAYSQFPPAPTRRAQLEAILEAGVASGMLFVTDARRAPGRLRASARQPLGQRQRPDRHARARDGGAAHRALDVRPSQHPGRHAAVRARAPAAAALPSSPLSAAGGGEIARRRVLHLRRTDCRRTRIRRRWRKSFRQSASVQRSMPCSSTLSVDQLRIPERILDLIPPAAFGYGGGTAEAFARRTDPDLRSDRRRRHRRRPRDQRAPPARTRRPPGAAIVA